MKKFSLFCALLVGIAVMTGCQKDQDTVTLKAVVDQNTKAYFGADADNNLSLPYWDGDDRVYLKGYNRDFTRESSRLENLSTTFATISGVPISSVYCAIFPASAVIEMGTPNATGTTAVINFDHDQKYIWDEVNQRQRLEMPMGAVSTNNTLIFKNLCGILRVKVVNSTRTDFNMKRLSVMSDDGTFIAGKGNITLSKNGNPQISMSPYHDYTVDQAIQLHADGYSSMGTIPASGTNNFKVFDIIVPPFTASALTFDVESVESGTGFGFFEYKVNRSVSVDRNDIAEITLTITSFQVNDHAYLIDGPSFNDSIKSLGLGGITTIMFNSPVVGLPSDRTKYVRLEASYSPLPVYGYIDAGTPEVLHISSPATEWYANADCSYMFAGIPSVQTLSINIDAFITEDVTNMSHMFAGCSNLGNVPRLPYFVTTNVERMEYMFDGCEKMGAIDLQSFSTQHLRPDGMKCMFRGCATLRTLDLRNFTTEQITTMDSLFYGCSVLNDLYINKFVISNNTTLTEMCTGLNAGRNVNNKCSIYCTSDVRTTLLSQDANNNYITGIDPTLVSFPLQETAK